MIEPYYTPDEVAAMLKKSKKTVLNWISAGRISAMQVRPPLISETALKDFLRRNTKKAVV